MEITQLNSSQIINLFERLKSDADSARRKTLFPGKKPTQAERVEIEHARAVAEARFEKFLDLADPDRKARGKRLARDVRAEEDELLARLGL